MTKSAVCRFSISLLAVAGLAAAQDQTPHAWRSVNDPLPAALDQAPGQQPDQSINLNAQPDQSQAAIRQSDQVPPQGIRRVRLMQPLQPMLAASVQRSGTRQELSASPTTTAFRPS